MKVSRVSSAPRMQRVYTPRVKDGRMSNENPEVHYYNKTGTRFSNANPHYHYKYLYFYSVLKTVLLNGESTPRRSNMMSNNSLSRN